MGTRAGEVTDTTAIVWTRLTQYATRNNTGIIVPPRVKAKKKDATQPPPEPPPQPAKLTVPAEQLEGACPGAPSRVQLRYGTREDLSDTKMTECGEASAENDFICEFKLAGLKPGTVYSVHPYAGVHEFSVGAASDEHAGGTPGEDPKFHKFHRVQGGFLTVTLRREGAKSRILFEHRDVMGKVAYSWNAERAV